MRLYDLKQGRKRPKIYFKCIKWGTFGEREREREREKERERERAR